MMTVDDEGVSPLSLFRPRSTCMQFFSFIKDAYVNPGFAFLIPASHACQCGSGL